MKCPKCSKAIRFEATNHPACGWNVANADSNAHKTPCAHTDCTEPAILSRKLSTGWANLCKRHDIFHAQLEANEFCEREGLYTPAEKAAYRKQKMAEFGKINPTEHWNRVLATPNLPELSYRMASGALKKLGAPASE